MAEIELAYTSPKSKVVDLGRLFFDGQELGWVPGVDGVRTQFLEPVSGRLVKVGWNEKQGEREWDLWNRLNPEHVEFFQPIFEHGQIKHGGDVMDYVIVPFVKFDRTFRLDIENSCHVQANYLADFYEIADFNQRQYKPVNQGRSFLIHDYGGGYKS